MNSTQTPTQGKMLSTEISDARLAEMITEQNRWLDECEETPSGHPCIGGNATCPCQDGDICHYQGPNPWPVPGR